MADFRTLMGQVQEPDLPPPDPVGPSSEPRVRMDFTDAEFESVCKLVGLPWTQASRDAVLRVIAAANIVAAGIPVRT